MNWKMENEWRLENVKCKQITNYVQLIFLIQLLSIMQNLAFSQKNTNIFNHFSIFKLWTTETNYLKINDNGENNQNILISEILKYAYTNLM